MTRAIGPAALPPRYAFLAAETGPPELVAAVALYGVREIPGPRHSPEILGWEAGLIHNYPWLDWIGDVIDGDETPWCGLFMAWITHVAGYGQPHHRFLSARSWAGWGEAVPGGRPQLGDTCVFSRGDPAGPYGHVGLYVGEDRACYHILGGNQDNQVSIMRIAKARLIAARYAPGLMVADPGKRRVIAMSPGDVAFSRDEA